MSSIEIRTTQNVVIEYKLASMRERILAYLLDLVIFYICVYVFYLLLIGLFIQAMSTADSSIFVFLGLLPVVGWLMYHLLFEMFNRGQTIGKKVLGVRVVRIDGKEPGFTDFLLRAIFQIVDSLFSFGVVGSVLIASSEKRQRFGDMAANTTVVKTTSNSQFSLDDILKIHTLENYTPQYPEVRGLTETDVLLIKQVLHRFELYQNDAHRDAVRELVKKLEAVLKIEAPRDKIGFLKTLIRDYIVLTR